MNTPARSLFSHAFLLFLAGASASPALAYSPLPGDGFSLSGHATHMDYREHDEDGRRLNRESGFLRGFSVGIGKTIPSITVGAFVSRSDGRVNYDGQLQSGSLYQTTTDQGMTRYGVALQSLPWQSGDLSFGPYARLSYHLWNRVIEPSGFISGLTENYRWWTATFGLQACGQFGVVETCVRGGVNRAFSGTLTVNLASSGAGHPELEMVDSWGGELAMTAFYGRFFAELFFQRWSFDAGPEIRIRGANITRVILEPANETQLTGLAAGIKF